MMKHNINDVEGSKNYVVSSSDTTEIFDNVMNVAHYKIFQGSKEVIQLIEDRLGAKQFEEYCLGNIIKYVMRCKQKDNFYQDLNKAKRYIDYILKGTENG